MIFGMAGACGAWSTTLRIAERRSIALKPKSIAIPLDAAVVFGLQKPSLVLAEPHHGCGPADGTEISSLPYTLSNLKVDVGVD